MQRLVAALPAPGEAHVRRGPYFLPNLPVVDQDGRQLRFYDDLIKDKVVVIMFIYTSCTDICPITTSRMTQIEDELRMTQIGDKVVDVLGRDIFIISLTVDPVNDTPEKLKAYSKTFGTGPGWTFVTGKPEDIRAINYRLGERSKVLSEHRNEIVLGNDLTGEWQRDNVLGDIKVVTTSIPEMHPKSRDRVRQVGTGPGMNTGLAMGHQPGQAMFKKLCTGCHTIGVGDKVGPDLRGGTERRERGWLVRYLRNPLGMIVHDPIARALAEKFPVVRMPNMALSEQDAGDLISYMQEETAKLVEVVPPRNGGHQHEHHEH